MLSLAAPGWLAGWLLLPVIRWLHRGGRHRRLVPVARLGLWRGAVASAAAPGRHQPPDPAWRRRTLLAALVLAALAEPQGSTPRHRVTLWVDDSLSLLTREAGGTRLSLGLARARERLAAWPGADVEVRPLGNPWQAWTALDDETAAALAVGAAGAAEVAPPPAALLGQERSHWLLTDSTDAGRLEWPAGRQPDLVLSVGEVSRNAGLRRLAARRSATDPGQLELAIEVRNGGLGTETRELLVTLDGSPPRRSRLVLDPGATLPVALRLPLDAAAARLHVALQPPDALAEDDTLWLELAPLHRRRVADDAACPAALRSAVVAHPALDLVARDARDAQVRLECSADATGAGAPEAAVIGLRTDRLPTRAPGPLLWSTRLPKAKPVASEFQDLRVAGRLERQRGDEVLLASGAEPVIVIRQTVPRRLDSVLDLDALAAGRTADVPLLVNLMFEQLLGRPLLDAVVSVERPAGASRVAPETRAATGGRDSIRPPGEARSAPLVQAGQRSLVHPVLLAAMAVLLWELAALGRQWQTLRRPPTGETP